MITVSNIQRIERLEFETYKGLPGYSFSFLKRERDGVAEPIKATDKMILGTLVDEIRTAGKPDMSHKLYPHAKKIAHKLYLEFGVILDVLKPQVSYRCTMQLGDLKMQCKGRADFELHNKLIIDLKVTHTKFSNIPNLIQYLGYEDQIWGYARMAEAKDAYLLMYSVPDDKIYFRGWRIHNYNDFWADKILKFGTV